MLISDWSSDVCSSDLDLVARRTTGLLPRVQPRISLRKLGPSHGPDPGKDEAKDRGGAQAGPRPPPRPPLRRLRRDRPRGAGVRPSPRQGRQRERDGPQQRAVAPRRRDREVRGGLRELPSATYSSARQHLSLPGDEGLLSAEGRRGGGEARTLARRGKSPLL